MATDHSTVEVTGIGRIHLRRSPRAKRISIRIKPINGVVVTLPPGASDLQALAFVDRKRKWIIRHLGTFRHLSGNQALFDARVVYDICRYRLEVQPCIPGGYRIKISDGQIRITGPESRKMSDPRFQEALRIGVTEALRIEAKKQLPRRVEQLARMHGLNYRKVSIRDAKSRWGSCSARNNISLNLHLMRLPAHLQDYVILHELTHTRHPNHGKAFWSMLDRLAGNARSLEKELKSHLIALIPSGSGN